MEPDAKRTRSKTPRSDVPLESAQARVAERTLPYTTRMNALRMASGGMIAADVVRVIWGLVIREVGWNPRQAQEYAQKDTGVAETLAHDDSLWRDWWRRDFERFEDDLGDALPEWILRDKDAATGMDDARVAAQYTAVPWRRYYVWCEYFERRSAKLIVGMARELARAFPSPPVPHRVPAGILMEAPLRPDYWSLNEGDPNLVAAWYEKRNFYGTLLADGSEPDMLEFNLAELLDPDIQDDSLDVGAPLIAWHMLFTRPTPYGLNPALANINSIVAQIQFYVPVVWRNPQTRNVYVRSDRESDQTLAIFLMWYEFQMRRHNGRTAEIFPEHVWGTAFNGASLVHSQDGMTRTWPRLQALPLVPTRDGIRLVGARCAYIGCSGQPLAQCSRCKGVSYCSKACQGAHWALEHKDACAKEAR